MNLKGDHLNEPINNDSVPSTEKHSVVVVAFQHSVVVVAFRTR